MRIPVGHALGVCTGILQGAIAVVTSVVSFSIQRKTSE